MAVYKQREDGLPFNVNVADIHRVACCDCGLVHDITYTILHDGATLNIVATRNNRATAARRRQQEKKRNAACIALIDALIAREESK